MTRLRVLFRRTWRRAWWKLRHPRTPYPRVVVSARDIAMQPVYTRRADASLDRLNRLPNVEIDPDVARVMSERIAQMQDRAILGVTTPLSTRQLLPWEPTTNRPRWVDPVQSATVTEHPVWARLGGFGMGYGGQDAINPFLFSSVVDGGSPAIPHSVITPAPEVNNSPAPDFNPPCSGPSFTDCSVASDSAGAVGGME